MGEIYIEETIYEMPGNAPVRRPVMVPIARLPGVNLLLLRLADEVMRAQAAAREALSNRDTAYQALADLREEFDSMVCYETDRANRLERRASYAEGRAREIDRIWREKVNRDLERKAEEVNQWNALNVFVKLWRVMFGRTTPPRSLEESENERRSLPG